MAWQTDRQTDTYKQTQTHTHRRMRFPCISNHSTCQMVRFIPLASQWLLNTAPVAKAASRHCQWTLLVDTANRRQRRPMTAMNNGRLSWLYTGTKGTIDVSIWVTSLSFISPDSDNELTQIRSSATGLLNEKTTRRDDSHSSRQKTNWIYLDWTHSFPVYLLLPRNYILNGSLCRKQTYS